MRTLLTVLAAILIGPVAATAAPAATVAPATRLGIMRTNTHGGGDRVADAKALGVRYARPGAVALLNAGSDANARASREAGLHGIVTYVARANLGLATAPPTDLRAYGAMLGAAIDRTHPELAVIENEEDAPRFYSGGPADYLRQLRTAVATAHAHHAKVTNGGLVSPAVMLATWDDLWSHGHRADADRFARESLALGRAGVRRLARQLPDSAHPDRDWKAANGKFAALLILTKQSVAGYRASAMDYVNLHWYAGTGWALRQAVRYFERATAKRAVTNEIGQYDTSPATVTGIVREAVALRMPYVVWFASDGSAAKGLIEAGGALRPNGVAFRDLARRLAAGR